MLSDRQNHDPADLGHDLNDENARHDRTLGEMPLKKRLIGRHVFQTDCPLAGFQRRDPVYQQKRVTVRQDLFDGFNVQFRQNDLLKLSGRL